MRRPLGRLRSVRRAPPHYWAAATGDHASARGLAATYGFAGGLGVLSDEQYAATVLVKRSILAGDSLGGGPWSPPKGYVSRSVTRQHQGHGATESSVLPAAGPPIYMPALRMRLMWRGGPVIIQYGRMKSKYPSRSKYSN